MRFIHFSGYRVTAQKRMDDWLRASYRKDYDVMFSIEDPFGLGNRAMKKIIKRGIQGKGLLMAHIKAGMRVFQRDGIIGVYRKV